MQKCFSNGPSSSESVIYRAEINCKQPTKNRTARRHSTNGKDSIIPFVLRLLKSSRPLAVVRFIIAVVVFPFNHCSFRLFSHVGQEVLEAFPALTNRNTPASIVLPSVVSWIGATPNQAFPTQESLRDFALASMAVYCGSNPSSFLSEAPARATVPVAKVAVCDGAISSARAEAKAGSSSLSRGSNVKWSISDYFQPSKSASDEVKFCRHNVAFSMLCSVVGVRRQPALTAINLVNAV
jgi:hypothetical protein